MNNPSYLGTSIQYHHYNHIFTMDHEYHGGRTILHLDEIEMTSEANVNNGRNEGASDIISQLVGKPQPEYEWD